MVAHVSCPHGYGGRRPMSSVPMVTVDGGPCGLPPLFCVHRVSFSLLGILITLQGSHLHIYSVECESYVSAMLELC